MPLPVCVQYICGLRPEQNQSERYYGKYVEEVEAHEIFLMMRLHTCLIYFDKLMLIFLLFCVIKYPYGSRVV